jgi:hypothetical protein
MLSVNLGFRSSLGAFAVLALVTMTGPASAAPEDGNLSEKAVKAAIHYAVELSAQAQKMNLAFLFLAVGVEPERNVEEIRESRAFFRQMLEGFREGDSILGIPALTGPENLELIAAIERVWPLFDAALVKGANLEEPTGEQQELTGEQVESIVALKVPLLKATTDLANSLKAEAAAGNLYSMLALGTELSEEQHLLLEQMSTEFMLVAYGHQVESNRKKLTEDYKKFELALDALINGNNQLRILPAPTPEIRAQLMTVRRLWVQFAQPLENAALGALPDRQAIEHVAAGVEDLADNVEEVVRLMEAL